MIFIWIEAILGHSVSINLKKIWVKQPCIYKTLVAHDLVDGGVWMKLSTHYSTNQC